MDVGFKDGLAIITTVGGWIAFFVAIKYQSLSNAKSIDAIEKRLDEKNKRIRELEDSSGKMLSVATAEKKFVTKRELELTLESINLKLDIVIKNQENFAKGMKNVGV